VTLNLCGVDFGTSNSTVALPSGVVLPIDPVAAEPRLFRSVLFYPEGTREVFAGTRAVDEYLVRSEGRFLQSLKGWLASTSFHSTNIRNRAITLEDLCGTLLRRIKEQAEAAAGQSLERAVIGRPALFSDDPWPSGACVRRPPPRAGKRSSCASSPSPPPSPMRPI